MTTVSRPAKPQEEGLGFFDRLEDVMLGGVAAALPLRPVRAGNRVVYRRHWAILLRRIALPALIIALEGLALFLIVVPLLGQLLRDASIILKAGLWIIALLPVAWLLWRYEDWRNDYYVVSDDRVIDVDKEPLGFRSSVKEASIATIQNISMTMPNAFAATFDFGDVIIETAGREGVLTFSGVHHPRQVLADVSERVERSRLAREGVMQERRQQEMVDWLRTYDELSAVAIVRNPPRVSCGEWLEIEWRVGQGQSVETWLEWELQDPLGVASTAASPVLAGGAGNYTTRIAAGLGQSLKLWALSSADGSEAVSSPSVTIALDGFSWEAPDLVPSGEMAHVSWQLPASAGASQLLAGDEPDFSGTAELIAAERAGAAWQTWLPVTDGGPLFVKIVATHDGEALESAVHRIDPVRPRS